MPMLWFLYRLQSLLGGRFLTRWLDQSEVTSVAAVELLQ